MGVADEVYTVLLGYDCPGNIRELENCIESMVAMSEHSFLTTDDLPDELKKSAGSQPAPQDSLLEQQTKKLFCRHCPRQTEK